MRYVTFLQINHSFICPCSTDRMESEYILARNQITKLDTDITPQDIADTVLQLDRLRKLPRPKSDDEVLERVDYYFQACAENRIRPGIETLALALGVSRVTIFNWSQGIKCSDRRREIIEHAKMLVAAYVEQASLSGKLNPVTAIFLQKNWFGYRDSQTLELSRPSDALLTAEQTPEEIAAAIEADVIPNDD